MFDSLMSCSVFLIGLTMAYTIMMITGNSLVLSAWLYGHFIIIRLRYEDVDQKGRLDQGTPLHY